MAEGYKDFVSGDILTAAQVDDYLMLQALMRFADASARNTALSAVLTEGLVAYLKDVDTVTVYTGSIWQTGFQIGAWSTYTPTCFQEDGTAQTLTVNAARYCRIGRTIIGNNILTVSDAGSATNGEPIIVSMPIAPRDTTSLSEVTGFGFITDVSVPTTWPVEAINFGGSFRFKRLDITSAQTAGVDPGFALAAGDVISFNYTYESAA